MCELKNTELKKIFFHCCMSISSASTILLFQQQVNFFSCYQYFRREERIPLIMEHNKFSPKPSPKGFKNPKEMRNIQWVWINIQWMIFKKETSWPSEASLNVQVSLLVFFSSFMVFLCLRLKGSVIVVLNPKCCFTLTTSFYHDYSEPCLALPETRKRFSAYNDRFSSRRPFSNCGLSRSCSCAAWIRKIRIERNVTTIEWTKVSKTRIFSEYYYF